MPDSPLKGILNYPEEDMARVAEIMDLLMGAQEPAKVAAMILAPSMLIAAGSIQRPGDPPVPEFEEHREAIEKVIHVSMSDYLPAILSTLPVDDMEGAYDNAMQNIAGMSGLVRLVSTRFTDIELDDLEKEVMDSFKKQLADEAKMN